jgi:hypothetical protein
MSNKKRARENLKAVCSVSEMAQLLGLSRSRFYQLLKQGVFPHPLYDIATKRPFYPQHLQKRCLEIRNTGIGDNSQRILFYTQRKKGSPNPKYPVPQRYQLLIKVLSQMAIKTTPKQLRVALKNIYPEGLPHHIDDGLVIRDLIRYWGQRVPT